jgi:hypothetical protein
VNVSICVSTVEAVWKHRLWSGPSQKATDLSLVLGSPLGDASGQLEPRGPNENPLCAAQCTHTHTHSWELLWKERKIERARNERASSQLKSSNQWFFFYTHTHPVERDPIRVTASYTMGLTEGNGRCTLLSLWNMAVESSRPTSLIGFDCSLLLFDFWLVSRSPTISSLVHTLSCYTYTNRKRPAEVFSFDNMRDAERSAIFETTQNWKTFPTHSRLANVNESAFIRRTTFFPKKITWISCDMDFFSSKYLFGFILVKT